MPTPSTAFFSLGNNLNQRDTMRVRKTVSGLLKLALPHGEFDKEAVERCLRYALEGRRRVKEQLKKLGGMEFYDYISATSTRKAGKKNLSAYWNREEALSSQRPPQPGNPPNRCRRWNKWTPRLYRLNCRSQPETEKLSISGVGTSSMAKEPIRSPSIISRRTQPVSALPPSRRSETNTCTLSSCTIPAPQT